MAVLWERQLLRQPGAVYQSATRTFRIDSLTSTARELLMAFGSHPVREAASLPAKSVGDLARCYSLRINIQHRLVCNV